MVRGGHAYSNLRGHRSACLWQVHMIIAAAAVSAACNDVRKLPSRLFLLPDAPSALHMHVTPMRCFKFARCLSDHCSTIQLCLAPEIDNRRCVNRVLQPCD